MEGNSLQVVPLKTRHLGNGGFWGDHRVVRGTGRGISRRRQSIKGGDGGQLNVNEGDHTNITEV